MGSVAEWPVAVDVVVVALGAAATVNDTTAVAPAWFASPE